MAFPVRTILLPAVLDGQANGRLPSSILTATPGRGGGATVTLVDPAARAWRAMAHAAAKAGHTLKTSATNSSYRPYADQERIFRQRYVQWDTGNERRTWLGYHWWKRDGVAAAAVPGTSNHGRGLAVDTGEERDGDTGVEPLDDGTLSWLVANADRFGWSWERQDEPWHLRYFAGDRIPEAVLDFERHATAPPKPKPPAPPTIEDEMPMILKAAGQPARLFDAPVFVPLDSPSAAALKYAGVKEAVVTEADYMEIRAQCKSVLDLPVVLARILAAVGSDDAGG